jgi:hypothetical protein
VNVRTPRELGGTLKAGKGENKTQAVALYLISRLPKPPPGHSYHVFFNNLFISTKIVKYAHSLGNIVTSTCRENRGVIQELIDLKKKDKKDIIP